MYWNPKWNVRCWFPPPDRFVKSEAVDLPTRGRWTERAARFMRYQPTAA